MEQFINQNVKKQKVKKQKENQRIFNCQSIRRKLPGEGTAGKMTRGRKLWQKRAAIVCLALIFTLLSVMMPCYASEPEIPDQTVSALAAAAEAAGGPQIQAPDAILMEASTGTVIYEKNADEARNPASVTKIMTLLLIFDALKSGKIKLDDEVVTSAHAKSMGGSQVFLEEGEVQTVETLIKCIVIASGNDASVAMAEYIGGDETSFVQMMNERAKGLGMTTAHFEDCCGLTDSTTHAMSAKDIALMTQELITKYPEIFNYSTIWMENITHVTKQGSKEFGLSNTNKLLKMATNFEVTGLKTGSTSLAKYCLSATARKDGVEMIAVVLAAPDYKARFSDAVTLLNYGYANCRMYRDEDPGTVPEAPVIGALQDTVQGRLTGTFSYLSLKGEDFNGIEKEWVFEPEIKAPVHEGDILGKLVYRLNGTELGSVSIVSAEELKKAAFLDYLKEAGQIFLGNFSSE